MKGRKTLLSGAGVTDVGRTRDHNEDAILVLADAGVFCVADGMGGAYGGELASRAVVETLERAFESDAPGGTTDFRAAVDRARKAVNRASRAILAESQNASASSGTTVALLIFDRDGGRAEALHAGDSRIYRLRDGALRQITRDHSIAEYAGIRDEADLPHMFRGVITRAVGLSEDVVMDEAAVDIAAGDLFLLCSDGLTRMIEDECIRDILARKQSDLREAAVALVEEANRAGGHDNISAVLIRVAEVADEEGADSPGDERDGESADVSRPPEGPAAEPRPDASRAGRWPLAAAWIAGFLVLLGLMAWWNWVR